MYVVSAVLKKYGSKIPVCRPELEFADHNRVNGRPEDFAVKKESGKTTVSKNTE